MPPSPFEALWPLWLALLVFAFAWVAWLIGRDDNEDDA